jgi:uncharacterized protein (DUF2249 family)
MPSGSGHLQHPPRETFAMSDTGHEQVVDVSSLPPPQRHPLIFSTFNSLAPGQSFILVNDHDPKPLYYQFKFEHEGQFSWEYLEQGPERWRVKIGRVAPAQ